MKPITIVIEVSGGIASAAFATGNPERWPRIVIVDLDPVKTGDAIRAVDLIPESLNLASDITREAVETVK